MKVIVWDNKKEEENSIKCHWQQLEIAEISIFIFTLATIEQFAFIDSGKKKECHTIMHKVVEENCK